MAAQPTEQAADPARGPGDGALAGPEHVDVLIVGAGLSGIGAARYLEERCPERSYALLEARADLGGTWDLFRYPGIRSDSDMHTLGYSFKPWRAAKAIADGPSILEYVREAARERGIDRRIRFRRRVLAADWSSAESLWHVRVADEETGETERLTCGFLWSCAGYYRYDRGYTPDFEGVERFPGPVVHPQHWPEDLDYEGKRVVVIGSGATAMTLTPAMAADAEHVTMLQRSPTYVASLPSEDPVARRLARWLPDRLAYPLIRWKNVLVQTAVYQLSRRRPELLRKMLRKGVREALPAGYPVDVHFEPSYDPWDQRLCLVPDGDLFESISRGEASVVTDRIGTFTERGLALESGEELEADVIVTATGLELLFVGGMDVSVDGEPVDVPSSLAYKGMMLSGVPNFAFTVGYTNASWTLKADLVAEYVCRLLNHMAASGYATATPRLDDPTVTEQPLFDFSAGYVLRSLDALPKQGSKEPWKLRQNYVLDIRAIRHGELEDGSMRFGRRGASAALSAPAPARDRVAA